MVFLVRLMSHKLTRAAADTAFIIDTIYTNTMFPTIQELLSTYCVFNDLLASISADKPSIINYKESNE